VPETTLQAVLAYLRENGGRYDLRALRDHLLAQGYDPATVEAAVAAYREERRLAPPSAAPQEERSGCAGGAFLVGFCAALLNLAYIAFWISSLSRGRRWADLPFAQYGQRFFDWGVLFVVEWGGGLVLVLSRRRLGPNSGFWRRVGEGLLLGPLLTIGLVVVLIATGIGACFWIVGHKG
jgi:hypothetical protein